MITNYEYIVSLCTVQGVTFELKALLFFGQKYFYKIYSLAAYSANSLRLFNYIPYSMLFQ